MEFFKKRTSFRFMALRRRWYVVSGALILASILLRTWYPVQRFQSALP